MKLNSPLTYIIIVTFITIFFKEIFNVSFKDYSLPEKLKPLERHKKRLTVIQTLSGAGMNDDHTKGYGTLSLRNSKGNVAVAPTIDCILGKYLSNQN